jgi:hypothetical protein
MAFIKQRLGRNVSAAIYPATRRGTMTQLPPDDKQLQEFLRKHRPTPPPAADDLEEQLH